MIALAPFDAYKAQPGQETLTALLRAHQDTVYTVALQVLHHPENAQDVSQSVLLKALGHLPRMADADHFRRWLHTVAFREALNARRNLRKRLECEKLPRPTASPTDGEIVDTIQEHVARLDDDLRAVLVERFFGEKSLAAIAQERRCSTAGIWKKLEKAKESLRKSLAEAGVAGAAPLLDPYLQSIASTPAPAGLLTPGFLAQAAASSSAALSIGGLAMTVKSIAATAALLLAGGGAVGYAVGQRHHAQVLEAEQDRSEKNLGTTEEETRRLDQETRQLEARSLELRRQHETLLAQAKVASKAAPPVESGESVAEAQDAMMKGGLALLTKQNLRRRVARWVASLNLSPEQRKAADDLVEAAGKELAEGWEKGVVPGIPIRRRFAEILTPEQREAFAQAKDQERQKESQALEGDILDLHAKDPLTPAQLDTLRSVIEEARKHWEAIEDQFFTDPVAPEKRRRGEREFVEKAAGMMRVMTPEELERMRQAPSKFLDGMKRSGK